MAQGKDQLEDRTGGSRQARADIDRTRQAMDRTIDAIEGRLTPGQLLVEGLGLLRSGGTSGATKIVELAREHPVPAAVIGVGVGMMIRDISQKKGDGHGAPSAPGYAAGYGYGGGDGGLRDRMADAAGTARERVGDAAHSARATVSEAAQSVRETASEATQAARDTIAGAAQSVRQTATSATQAAREKAAAVAENARERAQAQVRQAKLGFWQTMDQQPLVMGAAAVAVGLVAGLLIPTTRREDDLLGETRDEVVRRAGEKGHEILEKGKQVARVAVDTAKREAAEQGLTPEALADKAKTVGRDAVEKAGEQARREGLTGEPPTGGDRG